MWQCVEAWRKKADQLEAKYRQELSLKNVAGSELAFDLSLGRKNAVRTIFAHSVIFATRGLSTRAVFAENINFYK